VNIAGTFARPDLDRPVDLGAVVVAVDVHQELVLLAVGQRAAQLALGAGGHARVGAHLEVGPVDADPRGLQGQHLLVEDEVGRHRGSRGRT
jgi:hypothetical protein